MITAKLVHSLAAIEEGIVVAIVQFAFVKNDRFVVRRKTVLQNPIARPLCFQGVVITCVRQRQYASSSHRTAAVVATLSRILKRLILRREAATHICHCIVDWLLWNIETAIP